MQEETDGVEISPLAEGDHEPVVEIMNRDTGSQEITIDCSCGWRGTKQFVYYEDQKQLTFDHGEACSSIAVNLEQTSLSEYARHVADVDHNALIGPFGPVDDDQPGPYVP